MNGAKEDAANQHPQHNGQPAKHSGLDGAVDGACSCNGGKLVAEYHVGISRHIVHTILHLIGWGLCIGVNAPFLCQISAVNQIGTA